MGLRLALDANQGLRNSLRGFSGTLEENRARDDRQSELDKKEEAERIRKERLSGVAGGIEALADEAINNPNFGRKEFATHKSTQDAIRAAIESGDMSPLTSLGPIQQIVDDRQREKELRIKEGSKTTLAQQKIDAKPDKVQDKLDFDFIPTFNQLVNEGGFASLTSSIENVRGAMKSMEGRDDITGPFIGMDLPGKNFFAPESKAVQDRVELVVQQDLKPVLGAVFTEKEAEKFIARSFNKELEEPENLRRMNMILSQAETILEMKMAAASHFQEHRTLKGFDGVGEMNKRMEQLRKTIRKFEEDDLGSKKKGKTGKKTETFFEPKPQPLREITAEEFQKMAEPLTPEFERIINQINLARASRNEAPLTQADEDKVIDEHMRKKRLIIKRGN